MSIFNLTANNDAGTLGTTPADAGDQYTGLDRFGRLEDVRWRKTTGSMNSRVRVQYGFDRVGNRTWRRDLEPDSELFDEQYSYDGLYQVTALDRGNLNQNRTAIGGVPTWAEGWNYDEMGNWLGYTNAVNGAANLDQARLYNAGNELLAINGTNATKDEGQTDDYADQSHPNQRQSPVSACGTAPYYTREMSIFTLSTCIPGS